MVNLMDGAESVCWSRSLANEFFANLWISYSNLPQTGKINREQVCLLFDSFNINDRARGMSQ